MIFWSVFKNRALNEPQNMANIQPHSLEMVERATFRVESRGDGNRYVPGNQNGGILEVIQSLFDNNTVIYLEWQMG